MKKALRSFIQDIKEGKNLENYLLIITAIIVSIISLVGDVKTEIVTSLTLAVLALLIYREIENERILKDIQRSRNIQGINKFFEDRNNDKPFDARIKESKNEIAILGFQLGDVVHNHLQLLEKQAKAGCNIKLLMMSPIDKNGKNLPWIDNVGEIHTFVGLRNVLLVNIAQINQWLSQIEDEEIRTRIEVRLYDTPPTVSVLYIDKDSYNGSLKVEPLIYKIPPADRPSFFLQRVDSPELYDRLVDSFKSQWNKGIDISNMNIQ